MVRDCIFYCIPQLPRLEELHLSSFNYDWDQLLRASDPFPLIQKIKIRLFAPAYYASINYHQFGRQLFPALIRLFPNLEQLNVQFESTLKLWTVGEYRFYLAQFAKLRHFSLEYQKPVFDPKWYNEIYTSPFVA